MKQSEFKKLLQALFNRLEYLTDTKGKEYANSDDQLANFRRLAMSLDTSPLVICYIYLTKHLDAIQHYLRHPDVRASEPIVGRIDDAILYLILLRALLHEADKVPPSLPGVR